MVQIVITLPGEGCCKEWAIIEFQGDLETRHPVPLSGKFIGDLHFTDKDAPVLIIGHHILHGKVIVLEKPLAVIAKLSDKTENTDVNHLDMDTAEVSPLPAAPTRETCYHIKAVIRRKLLFKARPKPIIAHVPKKL